VSRLRGWITSSTPGAGELLVMRRHDDGDPVGRGHRERPLDRGLEQRSVAGDHGELLGPVRAVQRARE
jgi:hypothetical protein